MNVPLTVAMSLVLAAAAGVKTCRVESGPKTPECPEGKYLVYVDQSAKPYPTVTHVCEKPVTPPSPTPPPPPPSDPPPPPPSDPPPSPPPSTPPSTPPSNPPPSNPPPTDWEPGTIPEAGTCPAAYGAEPDFVTLGDTPYNPRDGEGDNRLYNLNVVPRVSDPKKCAHRPDFPRGGCEQWLPCASRWDPIYAQEDVGHSDPLRRPAIAVWGPGGFNGSDVVRSSREAYPWETPCPKDDPLTPQDEGNKRCYTNYYSVRMTIGSNGSPPGRYEVCVAPHQSLIAAVRAGDTARGGDRGRCRFFDLKKKGQ